MTKVENSSNLMYFDVYTFRRIKLLAKSGTMRQTLTYRYGRFEFCSLDLNFAFFPCTVFDLLTTFVTCISVYTILN